MELRSTGNPDISNLATMSMLEYLAKKGREAMMGNCKYPDSVCPHMTVLKGKSYCDAMPCQLTGELPEQSNADRIRGMTDEELAKFLSEFSACEVCEQFDKRLDMCGADNHFVCLKVYAEAITGAWLKRPAEEREVMQ